jgi:hypothetical protein
MKKLLVCAVLIACVAAPALAMARKTTYIVTNKRWNYVKIAEVKPAVAQERNMSQPVDIPQAKMAEILKSLKLNKRHLIGEEIDSREIFNQRAINYLAPALCQAFRTATNTEEVQFAYNVKDPMFILRNDRLTMVTAWVSGNDLYLKFDKLAVKLLGDTDKRGQKSYVLSRAQGIRLSLDIGPGQEMAAVGSNVMKVDLKHSFKPVVASSASGDAAVASSSTTTEEGMKTKAEPAFEPSDDATTRRLEKLDSLRKRGLITNKEYKAKKQEILNEL